MESVLLKRETANDTNRVDSLRDLKPWREVGWIFKDGEAVAIERQDGETRIRKVAI